MKVFNGSQLVKVLMIVKQAVTWLKEEKVLAHKPIQKPALKWASNHNTQEVFCTSNYVWVHTVHSPVKPCSPCRVWCCPSLYFLILLLSDCPLQFSKLSSWPTWVWRTLTTKFYFSFSLRSPFILSLGRSKLQAATCPVLAFWYILLAAKLSLGPEWPSLQSQPCLQ